MVYDARVERDAPVNTQYFVYVHQTCHVDAVEAAAAQGRLTIAPFAVVLAAFTDVHVLIAACLVASEPFCEIIPANRTPPIALGNP